MNENPFKTPVQETGLKADGLLKPLKLQDNVEAGIKGWIAFLAICIILSPIFNAYSLYSNISNLSNEGWNAATTPGTEHYDVLWKPLIYSEIASVFVMLLWSLVNIFLFFKKMNAFKLSFIGYATFAMIVNINCFTLSSLIHNIPREDINKMMVTMVRNIAFCLIWITYIIRSKNVKITFIK